MSDMQTLINALASCEAQQDLDGMRAVRERIIAAHPETEQAAEALYKVGLDSLFRQRAIDASIGYLEQAAKTNHAYWAAAARTSLGLCYFHQKRVQKALFELRKVAYVRDPTVHSVTALSFMENILTAEDKKDEAHKVRRDRVLQLEEMLSAQRTDAVRGQARGHYLYQLALALSDMKERDRARAALAEAKKIGVQVLGPELMKSITDTVV